MLWHLDDLESDFSVFHRVGDMEGMPSARFLAMAARLVHYDGAVRAALQREAPPQAEPAVRPGGVTPVPATKLAYENHPELRGLASFAEVRKPAALSPEQQAYIDAHPELQAPPPR